MMSHQTVSLPIRLRRHARAGPGCLVARDHMPRSSSSAEGVQLMRPRTSGIPLKQPKKQEPRRRLRRSARPRRCHRASLHRHILQKPSEAHNGGGGYQGSSPGKAPKVSHRTKSADLVGDHIDVAPRPDRLLEVGKDEKAERGALAPSRTPTQTLSSRWNRSESERCHLVPRRRGVAAGSRAMMEEEAATSQIWVK